jgi:hypothetical protein
MRAGVQKDTLPGFGPIGLCADNVVGFVQMVQSVDIFGGRTLAPGEVFLLILFDVL